MLKKILCFWLAGCAVPVFAAEAALDLPTDTRIDVQVIDRITLDDSQEEMTDVLLRPVTRGENASTQPLPHYCLITASARLNDRRVRLTTESVTCIDAEDDSPAIYSGELSAAAFENDGNFGLDTCTNEQDGRCTKAIIEPEHHFQLNVGEGTHITAQENPSAELNRQRRQADGEGIANPIPSDRPDPDSSAQ
ncbi:hypothetical protein [Halomonas sp. PR-M31]|uniref:hypothetical protein n=1 Tax=Halomonas sp. PR-M31 TaxID=1471202 RepID=UPI0006501793|nr:hypothetical protein [Halomonas sp. PR-M31]